MDLKKMKEKHVWSFKLLKALMEKGSKSYVEGDGNQPIWLSSSDGVELGKDPFQKEASNDQRKQDPSREEASNSERKQDPSQQEASRCPNKQGITLHT